MFFDGENYPFKMRFLERETIRTKFGKVKKQNFEHGEWLSDLPDNHFCKSYAKQRKIPNKYFTRKIYSTELLRRMKKQLD